MNLFLLAEQVRKLNPVIKLGSLEIRLYAICILTGAVIAYWVIRRMLLKRGYDPDLADTLVVTAFPAGIVGARLWWCICDAGSPWRRDFDRNFWGFITEIRDGGLAIQGGVVAGVGVAVAIILTRYKKVHMFEIFDMGLPQVFIAQAMGRWGNFFNQEVYGKCIPVEKLNWLPKFIQNQMTGGYGVDGKGNSLAPYVGEGIACEVGTEAAVPLYLYEGIFNLLGWAILTFVLPKVWKKRKPGDIFPLYLVWYGIVRMIMEPMRNASFIMNGWGGGIFTASFVTSIVFVVGGIALIVINRVFKLYEKLQPKVEETPSTENGETK